MNMPNKRNPRLRHKRPSAEGLSHIAHAGMFSYHVALYRRKLMSQVERWAIGGAIAAIIGVVVAAIGIFVAHHDAEGAQASGNGHTPTNGASAAPFVSESSSPNESTSQASIPTPSASPTQAGVSVRPQIYKNVSLQPLCDDGQCNGTQQVGSTIFTYTDEVEANDYPNYSEYQAFQQAASSCSELTVRLSGDSWAQEDGNPTVDYLKFIQQSTPTVYAQVGVGRIATAQVHLDGGPLYIDASVANDPGVHNSYVLLNITGTCSTPDGTR